METRYSTVTTVLAICLIVLTAMVILTISNDSNSKRTIYEGLLMLLCLFAFTASVIARESAAKKI